MSNVKKTKVGKREESWIREIQVTKKKKKKRKFRRNEKSEGELLVIERMTNVDSLFFKSESSMRGKDSRAKKRSMSRGAPYKSVLFLNIILIRLVATEIARIGGISRH